MNINITCCLLVLDSIQNSSVKKNDNKLLKVLVTKKEKNLLRIPFDGKSDIKVLVRNGIKDVIHTEKFCEEQAYTFGDSKFYSDNTIDIVYVVLAKQEDIKNLSDEYEFVPLIISSKDKKVTLDTREYIYTLNKKVNQNHIDYYHNIKGTTLAEEKNLIEILIAYKYLKNRIADTSSIFNLLPEVFTLEDVRLTYELIREETVDKSNFRKKYARYCKKLNVRVLDKGYRPAELYTLNPECAKVYYR